MMDVVDSIKKFVSDLRSNRYLAPYADEVERTLQAADLAADLNAHEAAQFSAIEWIVAQPKPILEKMEALAKLSRLKGYVHISSLRDFAGWGS